MADAVVQLPPDSSGKMADHESLTVGANTVYRQRNQVAGAAALEIARVVNATLAGTEYGLVSRSIIQGGLPTAITGTFLSTSAVGTTVGGDVSPAGNIFVAISGTYGANMVIAFEASVDSTNPASGNWFLYPGNRVNTPNVESQNPAGVVGANAIMAWEFPAGAIIGFRVRLVTVPASGTVNIRITTGTIPYEPAPIVTISPLLGRTNVFALLDRATAITTEALASFFVTKSAVQAAAAASYTVTAGKTLHIASLFMAVRTQTTATVLSVRARLRQGPAGGAAVAVGSAIIEALELAFPSATAAVEEGAVVSKSTDIDVPSGQQIGMSHISGSANASVTFGFTGYEY